jgi:hypothetical protein
VCRRAGVAEVWSFRADKAAEAVADGAMPPRRYTVLHPEARLSDEETDQLIAALDAMNASRSDNSGPGGGDEDNSGRGGGATAEPPRGRQALNGHEDLRHLRSLHGGAEVTA